jgi:hypothetical protein
LKNGAGTRGSLESHTPNSPYIIDILIKKYIKQKKFHEIFGLKVYGRLAESG